MGIFQSSLPIASNEGYLYKIASEKYAHCNLKISDKSINSKYNYLSKKDIMNILIFCPHLVDTNSMVDILIDSSDYSEEGNLSPDIITKWLLTLSKCHKLADSRLPACTYHIFHCNVVDQFLNINNLCNLLINCLLNKPNNAEIQRANEELLNFLPFSTFDYISKDNIIEDPSFIGITSSTPINPNGMASNGYCLFALDANMNLKLFPILDDCSFLMQTTNKLDIPKDPNAFVYVQNGFLAVGSVGTHYYFDLIDLISPKADPVTYKRYEFIKDNSFHSIISDGVVNIVIHNSFKVFVVDVEKNQILNEIQLHSGKAPICEEVRNLLALDLLACPTETNGVVLSFYIKIDNYHILCRQFSLVNGVHILDHKIEFPHQIVSLTYDSINRHHYAVMLFNGIYIIRSFVSNSSLNPYIFKIQCFHSKCTTYLDKLLYHLYLNIFPSMTDNALAPFLFASIEEFISSLDFFIGNLKSIIINMNNNNLLIVQIIVMLFTMNTNHVFSEDDNELNEKCIQVRDKMTSLLIILQKSQNENFPQYLGQYIFISSLCRKLDQSSFHSLNIAHIILTANNVLFSYMLKNISNSNLFYQIPINQESGIFSKCLQPDPEFFNLKVYLFFVAHQKAIIRKVHESMKNDEFSTIKVFTKNFTKDPPLEAFSDYMTFLTDNFITLLAGDYDYKQITHSLLYKLFENFSLLIGGLSDYHGIAQIVVPLLHLIPSMIKEKFKDHLSSKFFINLGLIYGAFSATLLKGGNFSSFEKKYKWLIWPNLHFIERKDELLTFGIVNKENLHDERIVQFIDNGRSTMQTFYKQWKPAINRNLKEPFLSLDLYFFAALIKHINICQNDMSDLNKIRNSLEQMIRVRNTARQLLQQNKTIDSLLSKCFLLLHLDSDFTPADEPAKLLANFVVSDDPSSSIINFISNQKNRLELTNIGFNIVERCYTYQIGETFESAFSASISTIDNFDGLSAIIKYDSTQKSIHNICTFLERVFKNENKNSRFLVLIAHKLIKCIQFERKMLSQLFSTLLQTNDQTNYQYFGVIYNRVNLIENFFSTNFDFNTFVLFDWFTFCDALLNQKCSSDLKNNLLTYFKACTNEHLPIVTTAVMRLFINSTPQSINEFKKDFIDLFNFLGDTILISHDFQKASSVVDIFRTILLQCNDLSFALMDIISSIYSDNVTEKQICAAFSILGGFIGFADVKPYTKILAINEHNKYFHALVLDDKMAIEFPIATESKTFEYKKYSIFSEPSVSFESLMFPDINFVLDFFECATFNMNSIASIIYLKSLQLYLSEPQLCDLIKTSNVDKLIQKLQLVMNPPSSILNYFQALSSFLKRETIPVKFGFYQIKSKAENQQMNISYFSPIIKTESSPLEINIIHTNVFTGFIGIVYDNSFPEIDSYFFVDTSNGFSFPSIALNAYKIEQPNNIGEIKFKIDPIQKIIIYKGYKYDFSFLVNNENLRIAIFANPTFEITNIYVQNNDSFVMDKCPNINLFEHKQNNNNMNLLDDIINFVQHEAKPNDLNVMKHMLLQSEETIFRDHIYFPKSYEYVVKYANVFKLPLNIFDESLTLSEPLKKWGTEKICGQISSQFATVIVAQLVNNGFIKLLNDPATLFSILQCSLEPFDLNAFNEGGYPFPLNTLITDNNNNMSLLGLDVQNDCKRCLRIIAEQKSFTESIKNRISALINDSFIHYSSGIFYPKQLRSCLISSASADSMIISYPLFFLTHQFKKYRYDSSSKKSIPSFYPNNSISISFNEVLTNLSVLFISHSNNNWVHNTAFEVLLLMKQLYNSHKEIIFVRTMLIKLILLESSFILPYIPELILYFTHDCIGPNATNLSYLYHVVALGSFSANKVDDFFRFFFENERKPFLSVNNIVSNESISSYKKKKTLIKVPSLKVEGPIKNANEAFYIFNSFFSVKSIDFFPKRDILPYWIALSLYLADDDTLDFHDSLIKIEKLSNVTHIHNPFQISMNITLSIDINCNIKNKRICISDNENFIDPSYVSIKSNKEKLNAQMADVYITIDSCDFNLDIKMNKTEPCSIAEYAIELSEIEKQFSDELAKYIKKWTPELTDELISIFPPGILGENIFDNLVSYIKLFQYRSLIPDRMLLLIALIIDNINYINNHHRKKVHNAFWQEFKTLTTSNIDAITEFQASIMTEPGDHSVYLKLNRFEARRIIINGSDNQDQTMISQFSRKVKSLGLSKLRHIPPWHVSFVGEPGIDAGGPTRELFSELATSIFEPTSKLFIPSPNNRYKLGYFSDTFIPFVSPKVYDSDSQYYSIGVLIGIIIRTGYLQNLPFAPLVWNYLSGKNLTEKDILSVDERLSLLFRRIRTLENEEDLTIFQLKWMVENWDGSAICVNNIYKSCDVKISQIEMYISDCIKTRINSIEKHLHKIRSGFYDNIGNSENRLMSPNIISLLTQGSNIITSDQLFNILVFDEDDQNLLNHLRSHLKYVFDKMTNTQRKLFLKFITALSALPNPNVVHDFHIKVVCNGRSDTKLPSSSTCFKTLYMFSYSTPEIAFKKIIYAIEECHTMEMY